MFAGGGTRIQTKGLFRALGAQGRRGRVTREGRKFLTNPKFGNQKVGGGNRKKKHSVAGRKKKRGLQNFCCHTLGPEKKKREEFWLWPSHHNFHVGENSRPEKGCAWQKTGEVRLKKNQKLSQKKEKGELILLGGREGKAKRTGKEKGGGIPQPHQESAIKGQGSLRGKRGGKKKGRYSAKKGVLSCERGERLKNFVQEKKNKRKLGGGAVFFGEKGSGEKRGERS